VKSRRSLSQIDWIVLLVSGAVMLWRHPVSLWDPVFFAEEGTVYFENAWRGTPFSALVASHGGYFAVVPNVTTLLAACCVPLEYAPWITTLCGFAIAQLPIVHVLTSPAAIFATGKLRYAMLLALICVSSIGLSTLYSMVYLTAVALFVLIEQDEPDLPAGRRSINRALLALAGLGSPMTCFLLPVVGLRAWRRPILRWSALILLVCTGVQACAFLSSYSPLVRAAHRDLLLVPTALLMSLLDLLAPSSWLGELHRWVHGIQRSGPVAEWSLCLAAIVICVVGLRFLLRAIPSERAALLLGSFVSLCVLTLCFGLNEPKQMLLVGAEPRYTFSIHVALFLLLGLGALHGSGLATRSVCALLFLTALASAAVSDGQAGFRGESLSWRSEVQRHRDHPDHQIRIIPSGWSLQLEDPSPHLKLTVTPVHDSSSISVSFPRLEIRPFKEPGSFAGLMEIRTAQAHSKGVLIFAHPLPDAVEPRILGGLLGTRKPVHVDGGGSLFRVRFETDESGIWREQLESKHFGRQLGTPLRVQAMITDPLYDVTNAVDIVFEAQ
jgi:hypothetical protein